MKNLWIFLLIVSVPLACLVFLATRHSITPTAFVAGLAFYVLAYRPFIDGERLVQTGAIPMSERWKLFIPLARAWYHIRYFRQLYLG